jgi:hypothetical protein
MSRTPQDLVNRVLCCMSGVVATLARGLGEIADKDANDLAEQALELASPIDDWLEAAIDRGWTQSPEGWCWREPEEGEVESGRADLMLLGSGPFVRALSPYDACNDDDISPYVSEVYEHWAVTDWLADKLIDHGEKVDKDFAGLCVWARTTTGQAIYADGVIEAITEEANAS